MSDRLQPDDVYGRKMVNAIHIDYARNASAWMGMVEGIPRLSVARGHDRSGSFMRWYVDNQPVRDLVSACAVINGEMTLEAAMEQEKKPAPKVSLTSQIAEVERELGQRKRVYPGLVANRSLRQSIADLQVAHMEAVKGTLEWLKANEADVRAFVAARAAARASAEQQQGAA